MLSKGKFLRSLALSLYGRLKICGLILLNTYVRILLGFKITKGIELEHKPLKNIRKELAGQMKPKT